MSLFGSVFKVDFVNFLVFRSYGIGIGDLWMSQDYFDPDWESQSLSDLKNFNVTGHSYTPQEQDMIAREARSAWQIGIVFGQVCVSFIIS